MELSNQEMESSKQEMELFLPLPGFWWKNVQRGGGVNVKIKLDYISKCKYTSLAAKQAYHSIILLTDYFTHR